MKRKNIALLIFSFLTSFFGQPTFACHLSEVSLTEYADNGSTHDFKIEVCIGGGRTGTALGGEGDTYDIAVGLFNNGSPINVLAHTPSITSSITEVSMTGGLYGASATLGTDENIGYLHNSGDDPFLCISSTADCGDLHQDCFDITFTTDVLFQSLRVFGAEGGGNPLAGCYPNADMMIDLSTALPVELVDFQAIASKNQVTLAWSTHSEANNSGFAVERSADGLSFEEIGWQDGHGTTSEIHRYTFIDPFTPSPGTYFYRLKQMDWDGSGAYSPVRSVRVESSTLPLSSFLFPNPNGGRSEWLSLPSSDGSPVSVRVFDARGRHLHSLSLSPFGEGPQVFPLELPELEAGIYLFEIYREGEVEWERILITKN